MLKFILLICAAGLVAGCGKQPAPNKIDEVPITSTLHAGLTTRIVNGTSMFPFLRTGDIIIVDKSFDYNALIVGDIAIYENKWAKEYFPNSPSKGNYAHMCYDKQGNAWRMWGINNGPVDNELMTPENYRGKVVGKFIK